MNSHRLDFADFAHPVEGLGPGKRLILWVRGCPLACPGCMTPELWESAPPQAASWREVGEIADFLAAPLRNLDGLSLSGGEPTLQSGALTALIRELRSRDGLQNLEVLSYSGFTLEELRQRQNDGEDDLGAFLDELDLLVDGRFEIGQANEKTWRGSDNQRVHLLSARAEKYRELVDAAMPEKRPLQLQMLGADRFRIVGIPKRGDLAAYRAAMEKLGFVTRPDMPAKAVFPR